MNDPDLGITLNLHYVEYHNHSPTYTGLQEISSTSHFPTHKSHAIFQSPIFIYMSYIQCSQSMVVHYPHYENNI